MPKCTEFLDALMAEFGTPAEIHAEENGQRVDWVHDMDKTERSAS